MYEIEVTARFAARHQLRLHDGTLEPLHDHDWRVTVRLCGPRLDEIDVLADFGLLRRRLDAALAELRDRDLNRLPAFAHCNPSAENVARHLAGRLDGDWPPGVRLSCVEIEEEPGCVARYRPA